MAMNPEPPERCCRTCRYWIPISSKAAIGNCTLAQGYKTLGWTYAEIGSELRLYDEDGEACVPGYRGGTLSGDACRTGYELST